MRGIDVCLNHMGRLKRALRGARMRASASSLFHWEIGLVHNNGTKLLPCRTASASLLR